MFNTVAWVWLGNKWLQKTSDRWSTKVIFYLFICIQIQNDVGSNVIDVNLSKLY